MAFQNLYRWEPGYEPEWVHDARKEQTAKVLACRKTRRHKSEVLARELASQIEGALTVKDLERIGEECKLGPLVLRRVLADVGREIPIAGAGYPATWPRKYYEVIARWIEGRIIAGQYGDEWLSVDSCVVELMRDHPELCDILTTRGVRMAIESHGFKTVRRADGRGIVGYCIKRDAQK